VSTNETLVDRAKQLRKELCTIEDKIYYCKHVFGKTVSATREITVPVFERYEGVGSDPEAIYSYDKRDEHGYSRTCKECGYEEYTTKKKPSHYEPYFGGSD
jgi:hypothetical protein